jgi:tetratricopeptide (TPR) repeat protein
MLLDQYPDAEPVFRWGAWFFDFQRSYADSAILLRNASRRNFEGDWKILHEALQFIREGNLEAAEEAFASIPAHNADWVVAANLGRIYEVFQSPGRALASYERAYSAVSAGPLASGWQDAASRLQVRIASCQRTMGRLSESRNSLDYALKLNPNNLNARLELSRLQNN